LLGLGALVVLLAAFIAGIYVDQSYPGYVPLLRLGAPPRAQLDRATTDQALRVIQANYYDAQVNYAKLSSGSVRGIVQALGDPYTQYLSPDEYRAQLDQYAGKHSGMVGIVVNFKDGYPVVSGVLPNSPALHAGLKTDDVIVRINGTDTRNLSQDQTATLIRGPAGTTVTLLHVIAPGGPASRSRPSERPAAARRGRPGGPGLPNRPGISPASPRAVLGLPDSLTMCRD
jgi:carboxyl-terminal processing protease